MQKINRDFKNFEHILRHNVDKDGILFVSSSGNPNYIQFSMRMTDMLKKFKYFGTICTTTQKADIQVIRYCFEHNIPVETVSLYSSSLRTYHYPRLPKKVVGVLMILEKNTKVTDSIMKYYSNFSKVMLARI